MTTLSELYRQKISSGTLSPDPLQAAAVQRLAALSETLAGYRPRRRGFLTRRKPAPRGFYFYGGVGRGKSMVMDLFFANAPVEKKRRVHFHAFMLEVHDYLHAHRTARGSTDDLLISCARHIAATATLLCFDEFHVKDVADAMILGRLFTALFDEGVVVVMTSNIAPDDLYADGLQRDRFLPFIALLKKRLEVVHFDGATDYRLARIAGRKVYFWPHDADAAAALQSLFDALADGAPAATAEIAVKGRLIRVPRAARDVAAFTFDELCEENKSALDYLELVRHYRAFVVSDVPKMNDARRNAAVRFMTFVDTLYDHHARLIVSAAAPPGKLYSGDELAAVFPRTVSRLVEMQSETYAKGD